LKVMSVVVVPVDGVAAGSLRLTGDVRDGAAKAGTTAANTRSSAAASDRTRTLPSRSRTAVPVRFDM
jgi:hypothetical protein